SARMLALSSTVSTRVVSVMEFALVILSKQFNVARRNLRPRNRLLSRRQLRIDRTAAHLARCCSEFHAASVGSAKVEAHQRDALAFQERATEIGIRRTDRFHSRAEIGSAVKMGL